MPLPKEIVEFLISPNKVDYKSKLEDYYDKIPTLGEEIFPDEITIYDISSSGSEIGRKLHTQLDMAGLNKNQRAGMSHILNSLRNIGDYRLTIGDVRALHEEELLKLRTRFTLATPTSRSVLIVKKLFG